MVNNKIALIIFFLINQLMISSIVNASHQCQMAVAQPNCIDGEICSDGSVSSSLCGNECVNDGTWPTIAHDYAFDQTSSSYTKLMSFPSSSVCPSIVADPTTIDSTLLSSTTCPYNIKACTSTTGTGIFSFTNEQLSFDQNIEQVIMFKIQCSYQSTTTCGTPFAAVGQTDILSETSLFTIRVCGSTTQVVPETVSSPFQILKDTVITNTSQKMLIPVFVSDNSHCSVLRQTIDDTTNLNIQSGYYVWPKSTTVTQDFIFNVLVRITGGHVQTLGPYVISVYQLSCGFPIQSPYGSTQSISRWYDIGTLGQFILENYLYAGGTCVITSYVLDNDSNILNSFQPIPGITGIQSFSCANSIQCRTVLFSTDNFALYQFYIHIKGEIQDSLNSPKIIIKVGCDPTQIQIINSGFIQPSFKSFNKTINGIETILLDISSFSTNDSNCPIEKFKITETSNYSKNLIQFDHQCPTGYDTSVACRTLKVPLDEARSIGGDPPEYKFQIDVISKGGKTLSLKDNIIEIQCSMNVQILYLANSLYNIQNSKPFSKQESQIIIDETNFSTDDVNCPIQKFIITETSDYALKLLKLDLGCINGQEMISEACRKIIVPLDKARLIGGFPPEFKFQYDVVAKGGSYANFTSNTIEVKCSKEVQIQNKKIKGYQIQIPKSQTGKQYNLLIDESNFESSDENCPINSIIVFETTQSQPGLVIDQKCPFQPDVSEICTMIQVPTTKVRLSISIPQENFQFTIRVGAKGGNFKNFTNNIIQVVCSDAVTILSEKMSFNLEFQKVSSNQNDSVPYETYILDGTLFSTSDVNCAIQSFEIKETTAFEPGLIFDTKCPQIPDISQACRTLMIPLNKIREKDKTPGLFQFSIIVTSYMSKRLNLTQNFIQVKGGSKTFTPLVSEQREGQNLNLNITYAQTSVLQLQGEKQKADVEKMKLYIQQLFCKFNESENIIDSIGTLTCFCDDKSFFGQTFKTEYYLQDKKGLKTDRISVNLNFLSIIDLEQIGLVKKVDELKTEYEILGTLEELRRYWLKRSVLHAYIRSIDSVGLMTIGFDERLALQNIINITSKVLKIEISPNQDHRNLSKLDFKFICTEFNYTEIKIQLMFDEPLYVSTYGIDYVTVEFIGHLFFQVNSSSHNLGQEIIEQNYFTYHSLPNQMQSRKLGSAIIEGAQTLKTISEAIIVFVVSCNIFLQVGISQLWGLINSLELVLFLPLIKINFPAKIQLIYNIFIPISTLDILPEGVTPYLYNLSTNSIQHDLNERIQAFGIESTQTILNLGSIFYYFAIIIVIYFVLVSVYEHVPLKILKIINKNSLKLSIFVTFYQAYFEILIVVYLNQRQKINITFSDVLSNFLGWFMGLSAITIIPMVLLYVTLMPTKRLISCVTQKSFGLMYEQLKYWQRSALANNLVYVIRRIVIIIVFFHPMIVEYVSLQIILLCYINFSTVIYTFQHQPWRDKLSMKVELFNEITILIATETMLLYTEILDPDQQSKAAWINFFILVVQVLINLFKMLKMTLNNLTLRLIYIYKWLKIKYEHLMERLQKPEDKLNNQHDFSNISVEASKTQDQFEYNQQDLINLPKIQDNQLEMANRFIKSREKIYKQNKEKLFEKRRNLIMEKQRYQFLKKVYDFDFLVMNEDKSLHPFEKSRLFYEFQISIKILLQYNNFHLENDAQKFAVKILKQPKIQPRNFKESFAMKEIEWNFEKKYFMLNQIPEKINEIDQFDDHHLFTILYDKNLKWKSENELFIQNKEIFHDNVSWSSHDFIEMFNCTSKIRKSKLLKIFQNDLVSGLPPNIPIIRIDLLYKLIANYQYQEKQGLNRKLKKMQDKLEIDSKQFDLRKTLDAVKKHRSDKLQVGVNKIN